MSLVFRSLPVICFLVSLALSSPADAQVTGSGPSVDEPSPFRAASIDPQFFFLRQILQTSGPETPIFGPGGPGSAADEQGASALLRFSSRLTPTQISTLESSGIRLMRTSDGRPVSLGKVYAARVPWDALDFAAGFPGLVRADAAWSPFRMRPLELTSELVGAPSVWRRPNSGVDGTGQIIADIDSAVDVLHPHLFHADGGHFRWIDVDGNGTLNPGVDRVDYNRDGVPDDNEVLRLMDATTVDFRTDESSNRDAVLDPRSDWLYADMNRDEVRNAGVSEGFSDSDPGYGEPVFVVDDVDGDGRLGLDEKLVLLGTSKIRKVVTPDRTYRRGVDLIEAGQPEDVTFHGTGVASILAGGQFPYHDRLGIAPEAELLMYLSWEPDAPRRGPATDYTVPLRALQDAVESGAGVIIHEWTDPFGVPQDGSTNLEAAMGEARAAGAVQVNPVGNLNLSQKHLEREILPGDSLTLTFDVGNGFEFRGERVPFASVFVSIFWRESQMLSFDLVAPDGTRRTLQLNQNESVIGDDTVQATWEVTQRGTNHLLLYLWAPDQQTSLQQGLWKVEVSDVIEKDFLVGRVSDYYSTWAPGVHWTEPTRDRGTVVFPATADAAVGVTAFGGRSDATRWDDSRAGELRNYAGRGPRIDGAPVVDISAPDDPFVAMAATTALMQAGFGRHWFASFGGTSGAGPHVAGAFALLKQANPDWTPDELEDRIFATASASRLEPDFGDLPNRHWGYGKLDVYRALYEADPPLANGPPRAALELRLTDEVVFDASNSLDPDGDALFYRYDFEYDGLWDTEWTSEATLSVPAENFSVAEILARVEVRDEHGASKGALVRFRLSDPGPSADAGAGDAGDVGSPGPPNQGGDDNGVCLLCAVGKDPGTPPSSLLLLIFAVMFRRCRRDLS